MEYLGFPTSSRCSANFTKTAINMENAAFFAFPIPVRHAANVSIPASDTAEMDVSLKSVTNVAVSASFRFGYRNAAIGLEKRKSPTAHGSARIRVTVSAYRARFFPSSLSPRA